VANVRGSILLKRPAQSCLHAKKTGRLKRWTVFSYTIVILSLPDKAAFPQAADGTGVKSWLPRTLNQSLQESLSKAIDHVNTRAGCLSVLEGKMSESSDQLNPKFIVTCSSLGNATLNFVYWQSDIEDGFKGVTYPEKQKKRVFSVAEQQRLKLLKLRDDNSDLIANCQVQLESKLGDNALYSESDVKISQRGEQLPIVYIEYSAGQSEFSLLYTATCRRDISKSIQMTIFPRYRR
tara:strand:+ start:179 stop:886 length:708 start_codon:yes stop_codon:yes gene_type:complete